MRRLLDGGRVRATLGPTNTGKTHHAIRRMLQHPSGMIGLPLRLLAREVYDRVVAERGVDAVALVTGEEKITPPGARYHVCTVEAMPVDRPVSFLAVDEVQLAGDRTRGHAFTDRILHARGGTETVFLGSLTVAPLLRRLVPEVEVETLPRLSTLRWGGHRKLTALPPRSAVVAFSVTQVYALAERLRARAGGAAVVVGALSPRARNAQVAMFQEGGVRLLVATDAIGMGLNLALDHVAFTAVRKYDGRGVRDLTPAELAQIAGRAGRHRRDGTFGTTGDQEPLEPAVIEAIEGHRFPPLRKLYWRSAELDHRSVDGLLASLRVAPPHDFLVPQRQADDQLALEALAAMPRVREVATTEARVRLLWEVCGVPDFRKTLTGSHAQLLARVYLHLVDGPLPAGFVDTRLGRLDRLRGDLDALTTRLAYVRTWSFMAQRDGWIADAAGVRERARDLEDRLSDALHHALQQRFVERRLGGGTARLDGERLVVEGQPLGTVRGLRFTPHPTALTMRQGQLEAAVRRALEGSLGETLAALDRERHALVLGGDRLLRWRDHPLARLDPGDAPDRPRLRLLLQDVLPPSVRRRAREVVEGWLAGRLTGLLGPCEAAGDAVLVGALRAGLGTARLTDAHRGSAGVRVHGGLAWCPRALHPRQQQLRSVLWAAWRGLDAAPSIPRVVEPLCREPAEYLALGWAPLEQVALRADRLPRASGMSSDALANWLDCDLGLARRLRGDLRRVGAATERRNRPRPGRGRG